MAPKNEKQFAAVVENGHLPPSIRQSIINVLRGLEGKRVLLTIKQITRKRSLNQNAFYWGCIIPAVRQMFEDAGTTLDEEDVHDFLKANVGGLKRVIADPAGVRHTVARSTTSLTTIEFEEYLEKVRAWAAAFDVVLPFPNENILLGC